MKRIPTILALLCSFALVAAACGDDDDTSTDDASSADDGGDDASGAGDDSGDGGGKSTSDASAEELEVWQTDLNAVGCYVGPVDGALGPQSEAAIRAFQAAQGLTVDGLLGPATEGALLDAVAAGETVCTGDVPGGDGDSPSDDVPGGDGDAPAGEATLSAASYDATFPLGSCSLNADVANMSLQGQTNNITLVVDAAGGAGTLAVDGGTEQDGITLGGTIESVSIGGDRSFSASGTFGEPNFAGESFTLSGTCPE